MKTLLTGRRRSSPARLPARRRRLPQKPCSQRPLRLTARPSERPEWLTRGRVPCLDGLRGVAILFVLCCHGAFTRGFPFPSLAAWVIRVGTLGVDLFFGISGFLITLLLLREIESTQGVSLGRFYLRRALRLLPVYLVFVGVLFLLSRTANLPFTGRAWIAMLTHTVNINLCSMRWESLHLWSLSTEEQFYLLWPPLLVLLRPRRARWLTLAYLVAAPALRVLAWVYLPGKVPTIGMFERADSLLAGCLLALLMIDPPRALRHPLRHGKYAWAGALAAGLVLFVAAMVDQRPPELIGYAHRYSIVAAGIALIIWTSACHARTRLGRVLESRCLVTLGRLSYSLYLWQQLFLQPSSSSWACRWPVNLGLALAAASLSYYFVETPFLRLKARHSPEPQRPALPGCPPPQRCSALRSVNRRGANCAR